MRLGSKAPIAAIALSFCLVFGLCACSASNETAKKTKDTVDVNVGYFAHFNEVPLIRQGTDYTCGIACLHSILRWASVAGDINDERLAEACGTTIADGTSYERILQYMQGTDGLDAHWSEGMTDDDLRSVIDDSGVVMMPIQAWESKEGGSGESVWFDTQDYRDYWSGGHWVVACGYNDDAVLFMDPSTAGCYAQISWEALDVRWHDSGDYVDDVTPFTKMEHAGITVYKQGDESYDHNAVQPLR